MEKIRGTIEKPKLTTINPGYAFLYAAIHFRPGKINYKELLSNNYFAEMVQLLVDNPLNKKEEKTIIVASGYPLLYTCIEQVYLANLFPSHRYLWWDATLQSGELLSNPDATSYIIAKKEHSARKYETGYFQKWLIIYAAGLGLHDLYIDKPGTISRHGKLMITGTITPPATKRVNYSSNYFTHIFLWDKFKENMYLLFPYYKKIWDCEKRTIYINHLPLKHIP